MSQTEIDKVEKRGNQWCVVHCHGEEAGEVIKCFDTEAEALAMHRAIEAGKHSDARDDPPFGDYENFADCVAKNSEKGDPAAYCATIKRQILGDSLQRKIGFDKAVLDDKIILDDDKFLVMPAVIASEIVHQYDDGWAYKPADELEKMTQTAMDIGTVPVKILEHPGVETNYLLVRQSDVYGRAENFSFVKNLPDPKTQRPMRRGVKADIRWFKNRVPAEVIEQIRNASLRDVSIGFIFDPDVTAGDFNGMHYDYVQRNIFLNHIAAPIQAGRCPGPICGIGYDASTIIKFDAMLLDECPVCRRIKDVGFAVAGKRLFKQYGAEVLEVIEGNPLPKVVLPLTDLDSEFNKAFKELDSNLRK